jgi:hypothetical protein
MSFIEAGLVVVESLVLLRISWNKIKACVFTFVVVFDTFLWGQSCSSWTN